MITARGWANLFISKFQQMSQLVWLLSWISTHQLTVITCIRSHVVLVTKSTLSGYSTAVEQPRLDRHLGGSIPLQGRHVLVSLTRRVGSTGRQTISIMERPNNNTVFWVRNWSHIAINQGFFGSLKVLQNAWIWLSKTPWPNQLILKKVFHMASFWPQMSIKSIFGQGFAPDPAGGVYDANICL